MKNKRTYLLALLLCLSSWFYSLDLKAQHVFLPQYTTFNGLANNNCYFLLQDKQGFIWIGTDAGVSRFDGTNFQNFSIDDGLPDTQIIQIKEDKEGKIWFFGLNAELGYYHNGKFFNKGNEAFLKNINYNTIFISIALDKEKNIWIGTNTNMILRWNGKGFDSFMPEQKEINVSNAFLMEDAEGVIWAYNDSGSFKFDGRRFIPIQQLVTPLSFRSVQKTPDNKILILSKKGLYLIENKSFKLLVPIPDHLLTNSSGYFYYNPRDKSVWINTNTGAVNIFSDGRSNKYIPEHLVRHSIIDKDNNIWFATDKGIFNLPNLNNRYLVYDEKSGLSTNNLESILKIDQHMWLGTNKAGIDILNLKNFGLQKIHLKDKKKFKNIKQLNFDKRHDMVYFSSEFGLGRVNRNFKANQKIELLRDSENLFYSIKSFSLNPLNSEIALALSSSVVIIPEGQHNLLFSLENSRTTNNNIKGRSFQVYYDPHGHLWYTNLYGLNERINKSDVPHFKFKNVLTKRINQIKQLNADTYLLATDGYGLIFYRKGIIAKQYQQKDGLSSNIVKKIYIHKDQIWLVTNNGVDRISSDIDKHVIVNLDGSKEVFEEVNDLIVDDTRAYFATSKGLIIFPYQNKDLLTPTPDIYVTAINYNNEFLDLGQKNFQFSKGNGNLFFTFTAIDFNKTNIDYKYRLNATSPWIETKNRRLDFSSLESGSYVFEVRAKSQSSGWSKAATIAFVIKKKFYETVVFYCFIIVFLAYLSFAAARYWVKTLRDKEQERLNWKNQIITLEQQALQAMMNPHFIFNIMNSIQHFINTQNTESANRLLSGFAKLIRKNLDACTKSYISLNEEIEYLKLYLKLEKSRFGDKLNYEIVVDKSLDIDENQIPSMLLQPFVENAIWHGIMPQEEGGSVKVIINNIDDHSLDIIIEDDGVGITNSQNKQSHKHVSKGMQLTKERLQLLSKIENKPIELQVSQCGEKGTRVQLTLPLK